MNVYRDNDLYDILQFRETNFNSHNRSGCKDANKIMLLLCHLMLLDYYRKIYSC